MALTLNKDDLMHVFKLFWSTLDSIRHVTASAEGAWSKGRPGHETCKGSRFQGLG